MNYFCIMFTSKISKFLSYLQKKVILISKTNVIFRIVNNPGLAGVQEMGVYNVSTFFNVKSFIPFVILSEYKCTNYSPRSSDPFYIVNYYNIKWVTSSWTVLPDC